MARSDGRSRYLGADADGTPTGFAVRPTATAGQEPRSYPADCAYCGRTLRNTRERQTHMRNDHPA